MINNFRHRLFAFSLSTFVILFIAILVSLIFVNFSAMAIDDYANGFFYGDGFNHADGGAYSVIPGGVHITMVADNQVNKQSFIDAIGASFSSGDNRAKVGAAYVIQTMRGRVNNGDFDRSIPDATDIADWKGKVMNSDIKISFNASYPTDVNTEGFLYNVWSSFPGKRDVHKFSDNGSYESYAFSSSLDGVVYVIKRSCANPLGELKGLPDAKTYKLSPSVISSSIAAESDELAKFMPKVYNDSSYNSNDTNYVFSKLIFKSGSTVPEAIAEGDTDNPCAHYTKDDGDKADSCSDQSTSVSIFNSGNTSMPTADMLIDDEVAGTKVCYALSVFSYNQEIGSNKRWSYSIPACVTVAKKPKVQVLGGDLITGSDVSSSTSVKSIDGVQRTFGSWVEYGIFAGGTVSGTASGAAFAGGGSLSNFKCGYSKLSFANVSLNETACNNTSTIIGNYTNAKSIPDVEASFAGDGISIFGEIEPNGLESGIYSAGDIKLTESTLTQGKTIIIKATGKVTIIGNQTYYNGPYTSISQLPQLVIIANEIIINNNVSNVDAWLVAKGNSGTIKTCEEIAKTVDSCNIPLVVNGPVTAQKMYLWRTAGSDPKADSGDPAEVFNLRADAYLWASYKAAVNGLVQTVYTTELPPRL